MFEIGSGELRATFLGNHASDTSRTHHRHTPDARHYANEQRAATRQHGGHYTRYEAPHPLRGTTPLTGRYTPNGALHPLRGAAPEQKGCNAYGSGAAHPATRTNADSARRLDAAATRRPPQKSHVIWIPSLFIGIEKTAEFQRSDFKP